MSLTTPAARRDLSYHLHPSTNLSTVQTEGPLVIARGDGVARLLELGYQRASRFTWVETARATWSALRALEAGGVRSASSR